MSFKSWIFKHGPTLLGIAGMLSFSGATVLAITQTPKAEDDIYAFKRENEIDKLEIKDVIRVTWRRYVPVLLMLAGGTAFSVASICTNNKQKAALGAANVLATTALSELKSAATAELGEKAVETLNNRIAQDKIDAKPVDSSEIVDTGLGRTLMFEPLTGRYFYSSVDAVYSAKNKLNDYLNQDGYCSVSEWLHLLELDETDMSDLLGWNTCDGLVDLMPSSCLDQNQVPCFVVSLNRLPVAGFDSY